MQVSYCGAARSHRGPQELGNSETPGTSHLESAMLALITSRIPGPAVETADRDPGFLTLVFAVARTVRSGAESAFARRCALARSIGGPNPL